MSNPVLRKRIIQMAIAALLLIALYFIIKGFTGGKPAVAGAPAQIVNAVTARADSWHVQIQATGSINTFKGAMLKAQVPGPVTQIYFESGTMVKQGDKLIQIYPDVLNAQLLSDQAQLQFAKVTYQRYSDLYKKNAVSKQSLDDAYSKWQEAAAAVQNTEAVLRQYNVTAPFSGMVGLRQVSVGQYLNVGASIVNLQQIDPIRVDFSVPDIYVDDIALGQKLSVVSSSNQDKKYAGQVTAIDSAVDVNSRSIALWGSVPNTEHSLLPGSYALVTLYSLKTHPVIVIPQTALSYDSTGTVVYKVVGGIARKTNVTLGFRQGNEASISEGLAVGDEVVSDGIIKLYDGIPIKIAALDGKILSINDNTSTH